MTFPSIRYTLFVACVLSVGATPSYATRAQSTVLDDVYTAVLPIENAVHATCGVGNDDVSANVIIEASAPTTLAAVMQNPLIHVGPYDVIFTYSYPHTLVGEIDAPSGRVRCIVHNRQNSVRIRIGVIPTETRIEDLKRQAFSVIDFDKTDAIKHKQVRSVITAIDAEVTAHGAKRTLARLKNRDDVPELRQAISLRRADLNLAQGRIPTAHRIYTQTAAQERNTPIGFTAAVRAAQLSFYSDAAIPGQSIVKRALFISNTTSVAARKALAQLLLECGRPLDALRIAKSVHDEALRKIANAALANVIRRAIAQGRNDNVVLTISRYRSLVETHPHRVRLLINGAAAYVALGLPSDAISLLKRALDLVQNPAQHEAVTAQLVQAYLEANDYYRGETTADFYLAHFGDALRVPAVRQNRYWLRAATGNIRGARNDYALLPLSMRPASTSILDTHRKLSESIAAVNRSSLNGHKHSGERVLR